MNDSLAVVKKYAFSLNLFKTTTIWLVISPSIYFFNLTIYMMCIIHLFSQGFNNILFLNDRRLELKKLLIVSNKLKSYILDYKLRLGHQKDILPFQLNMAVSVTTHH